MVLLTPSGQLITVAVPFHLLLRQAIIHSIMYIHNMFIPASLLCVTILHVIHIAMQSRVMKFISNFKNVCLPLQFL